MQIKIEKMIDNAGARDTGDTAGGRFGGRERLRRRRQDLPHTDHPGGFGVLHRVGLCLCAAVCNLAVLEIAAEYCCRYDLKLEALNRRAFRELSKTGAFFNEPEKF
ncbi:MAG: hypothetical protein LBC99_06540 [Spirochaetota bacterium]|jgi:hypothetical protein|nr:hypothetical protein [Spirochaetota bacterium]